MESAIPDHLRCPRSRLRRVPDDYQPPYPSFVARHPTRVTQVVMAYYGVQSRAGRAALTPALAELQARFGATAGPQHADRARYIDEAGYATVIAAAYWDDPARYDAWHATHGKAWTGTSRDGLGTFVEVLRPSVERYETLFSAPNRAEGIAALASGMSEMVMEHAYWGGARDRIPASQTDALAPVGAPRIEQDGAQVVVHGHEHLCLIRSGQDWADTDAGERAMYLGDVEPELRAGMDFLRDDGRAIGCYANRYLRVEDDDGRPLEKSYGMSWWKSLAALERWAESHPTHIAIFGAAMRYLGKLGPAAQLKLYHEVTVARADEQRFEYLGCHPATGLLRVGG
ncbi:MAG: phenylacetaldoxime dehydratase family protein [Proteobacteria bacterium]|nr:phenylacetaldoxime dehydratase family protein [Pseudomonadota bacterium]